MGNCHISNIRMEGNKWMYLISVRVSNRKIPTATRNLPCVGQRRPFRGEEVRGSVSSQPDTSCILYNIFTCRFVSLSDNVLGRERDPENTDPNSVSQKWRRNLVTRTCSPRLGRRKERLPRMIPVKISPKIARRILSLFSLYPLSFSLAGKPATIPAAPP